MSFRTMLVEHEQTTPHKIIRIYKVKNKNLQTKLY